MTLADIASIGSLINGVAVLISLIYLSIQVRQAEKGQRTTLQQSTSERGIDIVRHWADADIARAYTKAQSGATDLTSLEAFQLNMQFRSSLLSFQDNFMLQKISMIDTVQLDSISRAVQALLAQPVLRAMWNMMRNSFAPEFAEFIERLIKNVPLAPPIDLAARLKVAVAEVQAASSA